MTINPFVARIMLNFLMIVMVLSLLELLFSYAAGNGATFVSTFIVIAMTGCGLVVVGYSIRKDARADGPA